MNKAYEVSGDLRTCIASDITIAMVRLGMRGSQAIAIAAVHQTDELIAELKRTQPPVGDTPCQSE